MIVVPALLILALIGLLASPAIGRTLRWRAMERELDEQRRQWRLGL